MKLVGWIAMIFSVSSIASADSAKSLRIMPLGDSITYGTSYAGSYRVRLEKLLAEQGITVQFVGSQINGPPELHSQANEGHGGWKIADIASQAALDTQLSGMRRAVADRVQKLPEHHVYRNHCLGEVTA